MAQAASNHRAMPNERVLAYIQQIYSFFGLSLELASVLQDASYELGAIAKRGHCGAHETS